MIFYFIAGGEIRFVTYISPINVLLYTSPIEIAQAAMEVLLIGCFIIQIVKTIIDIVKLSRNYDELEYNLS